MSIMKKTFVGLSTALGLLSFSLPTFAMETTHDGIQESIREAIHDAIHVANRDGVTSLDLSYMFNVTPGEEKGWKLVENVLQNPKMWSAAELNFSRTQITSSQLKQLSIFTNLQKLDISENDIGYPHSGDPEEWGGTTLTDLNAAIHDKHQKFGRHGVFPDALKVSTTLTDLNAGGNDLHGKVEWLKKAMNLQTLQLAESCFHLEDHAKLADVLANHTRLTSLDLSDNLNFIPGLKGSNFFLTHLLPYTSLVNLTELNMTGSTVEPEAKEFFQMRGVKIIDNTDLLNNDSD